MKVNTILALGHVILQDFKDSQQVSNLPVTLLMVKKSWKKLPAVRSEPLA